MWILRWNFPAPTEGVNRAAFVRKSPNTPRCVANVREMHFLFGELTEIPLSSACVFLILVSSLFCFWTFNLKIRILDFEKNEKITHKCNSFSKKKQNKTHTLAINVFLIISQTCVTGCKTTPIDTKSDRNLSSRSSAAILTTDFYARYKFKTAFLRIRPSL